MKGNLKRILSAFLALALVFSCVPAVSAARPAESGSPVISGPLSLTAPSAENDQEMSFAAEAEEETKAEETTAPTEELTKLEPSGQERFSESAAATAYEADDIVTFIVVTEEKPQLELFSVSDIAAQTASVQSHQTKQISALNAVQAQVKASFGKEAGFKMGYTYTVATTGFSVTTAFGNKAEIEQMPGVKTVYVAPTFALPEDQEAKPYTNNATTMIGADAVNSTGYTGKGQRIAILDTGILVDHPSFAALSEDKLEDPMTRESVEAIWKTLNAGQMTNMLNVSYHSSKIPFIFNYNDGSFNVANTYAGSDHGTHVAGIVAANKTEGSNVVGVAPDAQLVVMQVFQSGGGASWAVIMAALEDCVRLEVDAANLSLGAAAGYTDPLDDMLEVLNLFKDTDIQVLIASGNDTNNAYMNAWGLDMSLISNPDIGLTGTPSTYSAALSVASVDNDGYEQLYVTVDGVDYGFQDSAATAETAFISNFRGQTLEYVVVPGVGEEADYEGLDVSGKLALISRGTTSFPEKQAAAQAQGAIGCVIYNNDIGLFLMQINDGGDNIPAVSVTKSAGQALIAAAGEDGVGSLTVCNADMKLFNVDRTVSSFSSWGVTPDLKLKPEISGVGGGIYSTVDPAISGSYYGPMSGTSMATPQIAGAMGVLIQYLDENFPEITGSEQRRLAANLLMSTADPVMATSELEYSPRAQGAGLANLVKATTTPAYLSNKAASEGRPKVEFGDDPSKTGVFEFSFQINNLSGEALVYEFDSSVLTESIYADYFIAGSPYALEAKVETPDQVTVPANGSVTVNAKLTLTAADKAYLNKFPNGIYVEGYLYANPVGENTEGVAPVTLTMPMVGFYGDWSDAPVFDDPVDYSLYPTVVYTYSSQLGTNPYFRNGKSGDEYNAFSYLNPLAEVDFGMLRNAKRLDITVTNAATGEVYHTLGGSYMGKTHFSTSYGQIIPTYLMVEYGEIWDGMDANGNRLPDGTEIIYSFQAWLDDGDEVMDDSWSFRAKLDTYAPEIVNDDDLQAALRTDENTGRTYLTLELMDNQNIAAVIFQSDSGSIMGKHEVDNVPGETYTAEYEITGFGGEFTIIVADYACNETEVEVMLNLGEQNNAVPKPAELTKDRLYGCETFDGALIEGGWFSANKADFSDPRNETFDSSKRYYSAEYVNGYLVGQDVATGHIELITPTGSYWSTKVLAENNTMGSAGSWALYDMALDHSGTLAASYGVNYEAAGTDGLFAVGWAYKGDNDNNGKDDGYNALFNINFTTSGYVNVREVGRISGTGGAELLTLGITTEGKIYGIDTQGILYSVGTATVWDDSVGQWGDYVVPVTAIGETSFVNYPGYGGTNVIQSMGYDHNTGTMYWYAHSQVQSGSWWENINVTYKVNLDTAECTEVGTYGPGGQTALFVPNDMESDLFPESGAPTGMNINPGSLAMVTGQSTRLKIAWTPWNAEPVDVTWASLDESIATVDQYGFVTALAAGEVTITASAEMMLDGYWDVIDGNWIWVEPAMGIRTVSATVTVLPSEDALYGYVIEDFGKAENNFSWVTYADANPHDVTVLSQSEGTMWYGGTYYNGYVWTTTGASWEEDNVIYTGTELYKSKVTTGETAADLTIGEPELVGRVAGLEITALGFDYNTGRMYCVENQYVGGLGIIDLDTAEVDMLGHPNGALSGGVYIPGLCVTADGTIVISDAVANLYTIDPDTLTTKQIHAGTGNAYTAFYEGMAYDHNTGNIYWNMCDGTGASPLYLIRMPESEWGSATVIELGGVSTKFGTQQTVIFTVPDSEPETKFLPVESIEIMGGDTVTGLEGGSLQLNTTTVPARPTLQKKTWTSSDESVVTVDSFGNLSYVGVGTATVTVSITNKDEATHGGPFTDSVEVTVLEAAGEFVAFLNTDEGGSGYYDFWLKGNDYDLRHTAATKSMIAIYSLRAGAYYDGYFYGYNDKGSFMRIDADDPADYKLLGTPNLDTYSYQVTAMAMDYTTGTMYGLTMPSNYDLYNWVAEEHPGQLVTIDLDTGLLTTVATLDFATPVYALACDADGQLYAAGGSFDMYAASTNIYKLDKQTGELTAYTAIEGANIYTGANYYGTMQYNTQMTYDFGTDRLYLYATTDSYSYFQDYGMYLVQLGEEPSVAGLGGISLDLRGDTKYGMVALGLLAFIPEAGEIPVTEVNGIILNTNAARVAVGETAQLVAQVRPSNASDPSLTWTVADESIATVDQNGVVTGVSLGSTIVTVTSNQTGISAICRVTVIDVDGPQSVAYTVSAMKDALISFNPAMPAQTAEVVCTLSGGSTIKGMAYGDNCLYYVTYGNAGTELFRFDFTTRKSSTMGQLYTFTEPSGLAYDKENKLFYVTGGFYLFVFEADKLDPAGFNYYANYMMDSDYCTLTGVSVIDGAVYTFGNDYYNSIPQMMRYSGKYLADRTVVLSGFNMSLIAGATDVAYNPNDGLFYFADAGHLIHSMDMDGNVTAVDILGEGLDLNGMAIDPTAKYKIVYTDGVDGEEVFADQTYFAAPGAATPAFTGTPAREGYTFAGWNPALSETVTDNASYAAVWTANTYSLVLLPGEGTVDPSYVTVTYGEPIGELPVPVREGYTFTGWYDADGNLVTAETIYNWAGMTSFTAAWTANTYTVTLDPNGGAVDPASVTVTFDAAYGELPVPTREGYTFVGWLDADGVKVLAETVYTVAGDSTLTAQWAGNAYTITLDAGEGAVLETTTVTVVYGEAVNTLPEPTKEGYVFEGWYDAEGNEVTAETVYTVEGDLTLTAKWTAAQYTITLEDGTTVSVTYGEPIGQLPAPEMDGYTFAGWMDEDGNVYTAETIYLVAGDISLFAVWTANTYTVTLNANGGKVDPSAITVTFGEAYGKLPVPTKEGYKFKGWQNADGKIVTAGCIYNVAGDSELTALWAVDPETGDTARLGLYIALAIVTLSAMAAIVTFDTKRKYVR